jgi:hypothetical protein
VFVCKKLLMLATSIYFMATTHPAGAQDKVLVSLQEDFITYGQASLQEKVFLHTDKDIYLAGEICWYKAYYVDGYFHRPLTVSKLVYVEILDGNHKPALQAKIPLKEGEGYGSFALPLSLVSGKYKLRAYTNWMKNFDPHYFFEKDITIINNRKTTEADSVGKPSVPIIHFFPEGGNLVNAVACSIAFRVADRYGRGLPASGVIINGGGDTVATFATLRFGMGSFVLTPEAGERYKAITRLPNGRRDTSILPAANNEGCAMRLEEVLNDQLSVSVQFAGNDRYTGEFYLFVHTRGVVKLVKASKALNGKAVFVVSKRQLGDGISHFTVFDAGRQPVAERLYFKYPVQRLEIKAVVDNSVYDIRKKISATITTLDQGMNSIPANLSAAVYRIDEAQPVDPMTISNYLWLCADLPGTVESPNYYFNEEEPDREAVMNLLMLTNGWRRFSWKTVLARTKPLFRFLPEYTGHVVSGKIVNKETRQPEKYISSFLSVPGKRTQFYNAISDSTGAIKFEVKDFYNQGEVICQTNTSYDSLYSIELTDPFSGQVSPNQLPPVSFSPTPANAFQKQYAALQVQNTYHGPRLKQFHFPAWDTFPFYHTPDVTYLLDNYVRFNTLEEVLREYVTQVNVRKRNDEYHLPVLNTPARRFFESEPLILLDGVPVFDVNKLMEYDPLKIRKLEVVSRMYFLGNMFFTGIANFITYNGNLPGYELDEKATVLDYEGLQLQREFYSPVYETPEQRNSRLPDFRSLLHWSPTIKTNGQGKTTFSFYSSDMNGRYAMVVQGITADGKTGSTTTFFDIKGSGLQP